ncbi:hypothetical protein KM043_018115 [Ampulex compressa]|nr:hypothetical protein KM043_018115 [Ampulex compressa]
MSCAAAALKKQESSFYFLAWASGIGYSVFKLSSCNTYFDNYFDAYADFAPGWFWIGRKQDVSDYEWKIWAPIIIQLIPWIILHHIISQILKVISMRMLLCYWYIFASLAFLYYSVGTIGMLCALAQPSLLYLLTFRRSRITTWLVHVLFLFVIHFLKVPDGFFQTILGLGDVAHFIVTITMCWIQLRSISYNMDMIDGYGINRKSSFLINFIHMLTYCLYLPTLCLGPLILYNEFIDSITGKSELWDGIKLRQFILNMIRYIFWLYFAEFVLHYIYFNALQYHPEILSPWALYGFGYCMGQFFLIKYVVIYGFNSNLCMIDGVKAPAQPKCIARVHLYSDMWKSFDRGLYMFLVRYIYIPTRTLGLHKLFASFVCFTFVFIWHGMQTSIFIWASLNFIGLTVEGIAKLIAHTRRYRELQGRYMTPQSVRRFNCILASPLLAMSAVSNFYFFAGKDIGDIFVQRLLQDSWDIKFLLLFFLYCCCQVSVDIKNWELHRPLVKSIYYL